MFTQHLFTPNSFELSSALLTTVKILAFAHLITEYVYNIHPTQGPSMLPTLSVTGDNVLISKRYRRGRGIKVGDVVEIRHPVPEYPRHGAVKRVIGLGGDFVLRSSPPGRPTAIIEEGQERMIQVRCFPGPRFKITTTSKTNKSASMGYNRFQKATAGSKETICRIRGIRENMGQYRWRLSKGKCSLEFGRWGR